MSKIFELKNYNEHLTVKRNNYHTIIMSEL